MAVVIYSEELGVYLGAFLGMGFWSKLDSGGQDHAPTFPSQSEAAEFADSLGRPDNDLRFLNVTPDEGSFASIQACVNVGLPSWLDAYTSTANERGFKISISQNL